MDAASRSFEHFRPGLPQHIQLNTSSVQKAAGAQKAFDLLGFGVPVRVVTPRDYHEPKGLAGPVSLNKADAVDVPRGEAADPLPGAGVDGTVRIFDHQRGTWVSLHRLDRRYHGGVMTSEQICAEFQHLHHLLVEQDQVLVWRTHAVTIVNGTRVTFGEHTVSEMEPLDRRVLSNAVTQAVDEGTIGQMSTRIALAETAIETNTTKSIAIFPRYLVPTEQPPRHLREIAEPWKQSPTPGLLAVHLADVRTTFPAAMMLAGMGT